MNADPIHEYGVPTQFRRVLFDLCAGAALVERFGSYETYIEVDGRVRGCNNRVSRQDLPELLAAAPYITDWNPQRPDGRAYRLPAADRERCLDMLQRTMPLGDLLAEAEPVNERSQVERMRA